MAETEYILAETKFRGCQTQRQDVFSHYLSIREILKSLYFQLLITLSRCYGEEELNLGIIFDGEKDVQTLLKQQG